MENQIQIFSADHLITMEDKDFSPGAMAVQEGEILALGTPQEIAARYPQEKFSVSLQKFPNGVILPGLVNAHSDLSLTLYPSEKNVSFQMQDGRVLLMPWLIHLSRYKANLAIPDQQRAVRQGLEKLKHSGVTTVGDVCRYPGVLPQYRESGLRVVCLAEIENIQRRTAQEDFEQALALVDEIEHEGHPRLRAGLAPFAAYTLSKNLLKIIADHAFSQELPLHIIAALSFSEMEFFYDSLGEISAVLFKEAGWAEQIPPPHRMTPVQYLQEIGFLKNQPALVGCLHMGPTDAAILQNTGALRVIAPQAFDFLQVGEVPWSKIFAEQIPWAVATLGVAWGSHLNLWEEMRRVALALIDEPREAVARMVFQAATSGGAKALKLEREVGSLAPAKRADFIVVSKPSGDEDLLAGILDQTREGVVASFVGGEKLH